jgi:hypothetical protein
VQALASSGAAARQIGGLVDEAIGCGGHSLLLETVLRLEGLVEAAEVCLSHSCGCCCGCGCCWASYQPSCDLWMSVS